MSDFSISDIYKNAWAKLRGSKGSIWSVSIVIILIILTMAYVTNMIVTDSQGLHYSLSYILFPIILYFFIGPFYGGGIMVGIKRFRSEEVNIKTGYQFLSRFVMTGITMAIIGLISNLVSIIVNIPAIGQSLGRSLPYLDLLGGLFSLLVYSFLFMSIPLMTDKNHSIGEALRQSFEKAKPHWLRVFAIFFLAYLLLFVIYIPAILGLVIHNSILTLLGGVFFIVVLIWFLPFIFLLAGNIYHHLVDGHDIALTD